MRAKAEPKAMVRSQGIGSKWTPGSRKGNSSFLKKQNLHYKTWQYGIDPGVFIYIDKDCVRNIFLVLGAQNHFLLR